MGEGLATVVARHGVEDDRHAGRSGEGAVEVGPGQRGHVRLVVTDALPQAGGRADDVGVEALAGRRLARHDGREPVGELGYAVTGDR